MLWLWPSRERAEIKNEFSTFGPKTWIFHFLAPTGHLAQISVGRRPRPPLGIRAALEPHERDEDHDECSRCGRRCSSGRGGGHSGAEGFDGT